VIRRGLIPVAPAESAAPGLLTVRQVAEILGVHPKTLPTLIRRDGLPCLWVGRRRRFDLGEVSRWLSERKEGGHAEATGRNV
jgi:excisionase family DNA binding protein